MPSHLTANFDWFDWSNADNNSIDWSLVQFILLAGGRDAGEAKKNRLVKLKQAKDKAEDDLKAPQRNPASRGLAALAVSLIYT